MHMNYVDTGKRVTRFNLTVEMNILGIIPTGWFVCVCVRLCARVSALSFRAVRIM